MRAAVAVLLIATVDGLTLDSLQNDVQNDQLPLHLNDHFPFQHVLFSHVPKTGGTSMRDILQEICRLRKQVLQICYNSDKCDREKVGVPKNDLGMIKFTTANATNQIVYGHNVNYGFAKRWGLQEKQVARVMMVRDPFSMLASTYQHGVRMDIPWVKGASSFDEFVVGKSLELLVAQNMRFFMADFGPADTANLTRFTRHWHGARGSANMLLLRTENYIGSVKRLAHFLGASPEEEQQMLGKIETLNSAPEDYEVSLRKSSLARVQDVCRPLYMVYDAALEQESQVKETGTKKLRQGAPEKRTTGDIVHLTVSSPKFVEDDD